MLRDNFKGYRVCIDKSPSKLQSSVIVQLVNRLLIFDRTIFLNLLTKTIVWVDLNVFYCYIDLDRMA